jgi:IS4 transposase
LFFGLFFLADSGFFNGQLFDLLEENEHEYLVKAKLTKTIKQKLLEQNWIDVDAHTAVCDFEYQANGWSKARKMYGVRIVKEYVEKEFFGTVEFIPVYEYFCYCTNRKGLTATKIHRLYGQRAESENWIENTKNQLHAGQTITNNFHVNDILWQLSVMAYNISVLMRYDADYKTWRQEPKSFREWFISVPGKVVTNARRTTVKMSVHYLYAKEWMRLADKIPIAA